MGIKTHQNHYVAALKPIPLTHIPRADDDKDATPDMHGPYMSLLGAIGWTVIGRADHCIYVAALQRHAKQPKNKHLRALNALLAYLKAHPTHLLYERLKGPLALVAVADSAYRREEHEDLVDRQLPIHVLIRFLVKLIVFCQMKQTPLWTVHPSTL